MECAMEFKVIEEQMEENTVVEWVNIVFSLDFCEKPEDLAHILLFPASSLYAKFRDLLVVFSCERIQVQFTCNTEDYSR